MKEAATNSLLKDEFKYFKDNHERLFTQYPDKYLVIKEGKVLNASDTFEKALESALESHLEVGTFLIQKCGKDQDSYTETFHSRVIFA